MPETPLPSDDHETFAPSSANQNRPVEPGERTTDFVEWANEEFTVPVEAAEAALTTQVPAELTDHPRYQIVRLLGQGGMGTVWQARHMLMERMVALKVIHPRFTSDPVAIERFRREVKAAALLQHPHVVVSHDAEQAGPTHFLVMEFVEGQDLAAYLDARGQLPIQEACRYAMQAALGLQYAHERGMVHRDIKPQNLMRTVAGEIKILDFGLARMGSTTGANTNLIAMRALSQNAVSLTPADIVMGTLDYLAPEQAMNASSVDIRADIYSLGCSLYQMLAGQVPFPGNDPCAKLAQHNACAPPRLTELRAEIPPALADVVAKMLAKNPAHRQQTPAEVAEALRSFAEPVERLRKRGPPRLLVGLFISAALGAGLLALRPRWHQGDPNGQATTVPARPKVVRSIEGWGQLTDPDGDCVIEATKSRLTIKVPGTRHNLAGVTGGTNAPRVLRPVDGNFTAEVIVSGDFKPTDIGGFNGAGLLLWGDEQNYVRLERNVWLGQLGEPWNLAPLFEYWKNGKRVDPELGISTPFFKGRSTHLRLIRRDNQLECAVSHDGLDWIPGKIIPIDFPRKLQLGIAAVNTSRDPFTVDFQALEVVTK